MVWPLLVTLVMHAMPESEARVRALFGELSANPSAQTRAAVIEALRKDVAKGEVVGVVLEHAQELDSRGTLADVLRAIAEPRLLATLTALSNPELDPKVHRYASLLAERVPSAKDPASAAALRAYLRGRQASSPEYDIVGDKAFKVLTAKDVADPSSAIEMAWASIPSPNSSLWSTTADVLKAYRGPRWVELATKALEGNDSKQHSVAMWLAFESKEPRLRVPFIARLRTTVLTNASYPNAIFDEVRVLADFSKDEPTARSALLDIGAARSNNLGPWYYANLEVMRLGDEGLIALDSARLKSLVAEMKVVGGSTEPFDFAEHFDITEILPDVLALLADPDKRHFAARLIARQRSDALISKSLAWAQANARPAIPALLNHLVPRYTAQAWARELMPLLESEKGETLAAVIKLFGKSTDPVVKARLQSVAAGTLEHVVDRFQALNDGLAISWSLGLKSLRQGEPAVASVTLKNTGALPIGLPLAIDSHRARWQVAPNNDVRLGPLTLTGSMPRWIPSGAEVTLALDLEPVVSSLEPGRHSLVLEYFSRSIQRHGGRDVIKKSAPLPVTVNAPAAPLTGAAAIRALVNSPTEKQRLRGWAQVKAEAPVKEAPVDRVAIEVFDQEITREQYTLGPDAWAYEWDQEDISSHLVLMPTEAERRAFFRALSASAVTKHVPLQVHGGAYENQVTVRFADGQTVTLWAFEAAHHPALAPWFNLLEKLRLRASKKTE